MKKVRKIAICIQSMIGFISGNKYEYYTDYASFDGDVSGPYKYYYVYLDNMDRPSITISSSKVFYDHFQDLIESRDKNLNNLLDGE